MIAYETVADLAVQACIPLHRIQAIDIRPGSAIFTVYSVDPVGPGPYLTNGQPRTYEITVHIDTPPDHYEDCPKHPRHGNLPPIYECECARIQAALQDLDDNLQFDAWHEEGD